MNYNKEFEKLLKKVEKPARYIGGEINEIQKDPAGKVRVGFAFPDTYEIGMSFLGMQILYSILNQQEEIYCERIFAPADDMEQLLMKEGLPLFTLETKTPLSELDLVGFTLQYELSYTNILNILSLGQIPLFAKERGEGFPFIIGGGPCAYNPEPIADFFDIFVIGDGEEAFPAICRLYAEWKKSGGSRTAFLEEACQMQGVYVPSFYQPAYQANGCIEKWEKRYTKAPDRVGKNMVFDLDATDFPAKCIVPLIEAVHDRAVVETFRGCSRGCRFCQAGMVYRPVRERKKDTIVKLAKEQLTATGQEELSLLSLSTSDHSEFEPLVLELMEMCKKNNVSLSLPSLRLDSFSFRVLDEIRGYKKSGLTFAPEAGSQRLRDVINKCITEEDIFRSVGQALDLGYDSIKLYFMIGLPTETDEDLDAIAALAKKIMEMNFERRGKKGGRFRLTVSVSNFVPKAHTPFQWAAQDTAEEFSRKHEYLKEKLKSRGISFHYHGSHTSILEAVFARGDRKLSHLLCKAHALGCKFDGWSEHFKREIWQQAITETGTDVDFYASRKREYDEILPWDLIDCSVSKAFLMRENDRAEKAELTKDCRQGCENCGVNARFFCGTGGNE